MQPLKYVVLHHSQIDEPHFDLLFETLPGSMLAAFRTQSWPIETPTTLTRLRDHRRLYLEYEGDLSGNRGSVSRIAEGTCEVVVGENAQWTLRLLTGAPPTTLNLRQIRGETWAGAPEH
ncbi:MAG TPA: hypothetical protein VLJ39_22205 [Tepidisphaeraceae bacterium]|nr:hypothetical protein [Tepidisphaeraceae bacterium]